MKIKIHLSFAWTALQLDNDGSDTVGEERIEWEGRGTEFSLLSCNDKESICLNLSPARAAELSSGINAQGDSQQGRL